MKYAPILIPTLCRHEHFIRLIESLKRNTWAKYTDVYIGLDYPPSDKYFEGYNKICKYLDGEFKEFNSFNVIKRSENYGTKKNMIELRKHVLEKFDRFIRTDDDAEFSPNFLEYMDKCLMAYEDDDNVIAVSGYSYPVDWEVSQDSTVFKENFSCPMWGIGFWQKKHANLSDFLNKGGLKTCVNEISFNSFSKMLETSQKEFVNLCLTSNFENSLASVFSDISVRIYTAIKDKYVIVPVISKVRNWGFDGTGVYCPNIDKNSKKLTARSYTYNLQEIDSNDSFNLIQDNLCDIKRNRRMLDRFENVTFSVRMITKIKFCLYKILGRKFYQYIRP